MQMKFCMSTKVTECARAVRQIWILRFGMCGCGAGGGEGLLPLSILVVVGLARRWGVHPNM